MEKQTFNAIVERLYRWIHRMEEVAFQIHDAVNQKYDRVLPYGFHLRMTAASVSRYGHWVAENEADVLILYASAYLHDVIEDARMTYNDVVRFLQDFHASDPSLPDGVKHQVETQVPEIVYALTNEKGRNRKERANASYYKGIRETKFAPFVKMCDRLANIRYSVLFGLPNPMLDVYRKEYPDFIRQISEGSISPIPAAMKTEAEELLRSVDWKAPSAE